MKTKYITEDNLVDYADKSFSASKDKQFIILEGLIEYCIDKFDIEKYNDKEYPVFGSLDADKEPIMTMQLIENPDMKRFIFLRNGSDKDDLLRIIVYNNPIDKSYSSRECKIIDKLNYEARYHCKNLYALNSNGTIDQPSSKYSKLDEDIIGMLYYNSSKDYSECMCSQLHGIVNVLFGSPLVFEDDKFIINNTLKFNTHKELLSTLEPKIKDYLDNNESKIRSLLLDEEEVDCE